MKRYAFDITHRDRAGEIIESDDATFEAAMETAKMLRDCFPNSRVSIVKRFSPARLRFDVADPVTIVTSYVPATEFKGSRIVAKSNGRQVSISYPYELSGVDVHEAAALAFCGKHKLSGSLTASLRRRGNGYAFTLV